MMFKPLTADLELNIDGNTRFVKRFAINAMPIPKIIKLMADFSKPLVFLPL